MEKSPERIKLIQKMDEYEKLGLFDKDVNDDPETYELMPGQIDYLHKKLKTKILTHLALRAGGKFFRGQEKAGNLIIKEIVGTENLKGVKGAVVTCNHFSPFDNYVILKGLMPSLKKGRYYKVIREGNYTNPPKEFAFLMKYGDTLPLSSNHNTMRKFLDSLKVLLNRGEKVLVYPEQSLWYNYRKPKPLKNGAYNFAISNNVPILPLFVTMEDTEKLDPDGFPIQAYTVHILPPIYAKEELSKPENIKYMRDLNYEMWVKTYEDFYKQPLVYLKNDEALNDEVSSNKN